MLTVMICGRCTILVNERPNIGNLQKSCKKMKCNTNPYFAPPRENVALANALLMVLDGRDGRGLTL